MKYAQEFRRAVALFEEEMTHENAVVAAWDMSEVA
jgi:hypothetical protein